MNNVAEPAESDESTQPAAPSASPVAAEQKRRLRVAALLSPSAMLATTALMVAIETKLPPYRGD